MPDTPPFMTASHSNRFAHAIWSGVGGDPALLDPLAYHGTGELASIFAVSDLAAASIGVAGLAIAELVAAHAHTPPPSVSVDRRLASVWFSETIRPIGWELPPPW